jgi:hypothetical protein
MVPETKMLVIGYESGTPIVDSAAFETMWTSNDLVGLMLSQSVPDGQGDIYAAGSTGAMLTTSPWTDAEYRPPASLVAMTAMFENTFRATPAAGRRPPAVCSNTTPEMVNEGTGAGGSGG